MALIKQERIEEIIEIFRLRGVRVFHACQLQDFYSYLQLGGVPSRSLLEQKRMPFTAFDTDEVDKTNGVWDLAFANLQDYGLSYAKFNWSEDRAPTPNPYGPILLEFEPECLSESEDLAICLRSAGGSDFSRENESLSKLEEIHQIFKYADPTDAPNDYAKAYIAYDSELQSRFANQSAKSPELSINNPVQLISFNRLAKIIVDPYVVANNRLFTIVKNLARERNLRNTPVFPRSYKRESKRMGILRELSAMLIEGEVELFYLSNSGHVSSELKEWATLLLPSMSFFFKRFQKYLRAGTVLPLSDYQNWRMNAPICIR